MLFRLDVKCVKYYTIAQVQSTHVAWPKTSGKSLIEIAKHQICLATKDLAIVKRYKKRIEGPLVWMIYWSAKCQIQTHTCTSSTTKMAIIYKFWSRYGASIQRLCNFSKNLTVVISINVACFNKVKDLCFELENQQPRQSKRPRLSIEQIPVASPRGKHFSVLRLDVILSWGEPRLVNKFLEKFCHDRVLQYTSTVLGWSSNKKPGCFSVLLRFHIVQNMHPPLVHRTKLNNILLVQSLTLQYSTQLFRIAQMFPSSVRAWQTYKGWKLTI